MIRTGHPRGERAGFCLTWACDDQTDLGWKQLLSDKHSMVLWEGLLLVVAAQFVSCPNNSRRPFL